jgi:hypothetical protein
VKGSPGEGIGILREGYGVSVTVMIPICSLYDHDMI